MQTTHRTIEASDTLLSVDLVPISPEDAPFYWVLAKDNIQSVIDRFEYEDIEDLYDDVLNAHRQLWLVFKDGEVVASVLTAIKEYHGKRYGVLTHAGGRGAEEWARIVNPIGEYFKSEGCQTFQIVGRRGWMKYLPDFKSEKVILEKKLG